MRNREDPPEDISGGSRSTAALPSFLVFPGRMTSLVGRVVRVQLPCGRCSHVRWRPTRHADHSFRECRVNTRNACLVRANVARFLPVPQTPCGSALDWPSLSIPVCSEGRLFSAEEILCRPDPCGMLSAAHTPSSRLPGNSARGATFFVFGARRPSTHCGHEMVSVSFCAHELRATVLKGRVHGNRRNVGKGMLGVRGEGRDAGRGTRDTLERRHTCVADDAQGGQASGDARPRLWETDEALPAQRSRSSATRTSNTVPRNDRPKVGADKKEGGSNTLPPCSHSCAHGIARAPRIPGSHPASPVPPRISVAPRCE